MDDWTSGFYPSNMWYVYELTGDSLWKKLAEKYTEAIDSVKYLTWYHPDLLKFKGLDSLV